VTDGHNDGRPQTMTMAATNYDNQLGEIYRTMLNKLNCTFGVTFSRFHCCGRHGHGVWPSWSWCVAVMVMVCGRHGCLSLSLSCHFRDCKALLVLSLLM